MAATILHKRGSGVTAPTATSLKYGELAINFGAGNETLYIRNSDNKLVKFNSESYNESQFMPKTLSGSYLMTSAVTMTVGNRINQTNNGAKDPYLKINNGTSILDAVRFSGGTNVTVNSSEDTLTNKGVITITAVNTHDSHYIRVANTSTSTANTTVTGANHRVFLNLVTQNTDTTTTNTVSSSVTVSGDTFIKVSSPSAGTVLFTALTGDTDTTLAVGSHGHRYAGSLTDGGPATSATRLDLSSGKGSATQPVYFTTAGTPIACTHQLNKTVPEDAVFTDEKIKAQNENVLNTYRLLGTVLPSSLTTGATTISTSYISTGVTFGYGGLKVNNTPVSLEGHTHAWGDIISGVPTTLSGYGITDAYTKTETNESFLALSGGTMNGPINMVSNTISFDDSTSATVIGNNILTFGGEACTMVYDPSSERLVTASPSVQILPDNEFDVQSEQIMLSAGDTASLYGDKVEVNGTSETTVGTTGSTTLLQGSTTTVSGGTVYATAENGFEVSSYTSNFSSSSSFTVTSNSIVLRPGAPGSPVAGSSIQMDSQYVNLGVNTALRLNASSTTASKLYITGVTYQNGTMNRTGTTFNNGAVNVTGTTRINGAVYTSGTTSLSGSVFVTGSVSASAGFYESSDERFKKFYEEIPVDFIKLKRIPKSYYSWLDDPEETRRIGTSAQKVQELYPEIVNHNTAQDKLTVDYSKLSIVALKAIDKLYEKNIELQQEIDELRQQIKEINKKLK